MAQTLLKYRSDLQNLSQPPQEAALIDAWLNSPIVEHVSNALGMGASIGIPGHASANAAIGGSTNKQLNTGAAFNDQGFEQLVRTWLNQIFLEQGNGGVVCVIDNLELLESGAQARRTLGVLRDRLFSVSGLR